MDGIVVNIALTLWLNLCISGRLSSRRIESRFSRILLMIIMFSCAPPTHHARVATRETNDPPRGGGDRSRGGQAGQSHVLAFHLARARFGSRRSSNVGSDAAATDGAPRRLGRRIARSVSRSLVSRALAGFIAAAVRGLFDPSCRRLTHRGAKRPT